MLHLCLQNVPLVVQVKELGGVVQNCSCMAEDMGKIFDVYWYLGDSSKVPADWPASYSTQINSSHPAEITYNSQPASTYLSVSNKSHYFFVSVFISFIPVPHISVVTTCPQKM